MVALQIILPSLFLYLILKCFNNSNDDDWNNAYCVLTMCLVLYHEQHITLSHLI